tara:strand:+ start:1858 stop:2319 length:462 start_codon:yes stop_codon:yes gene_type:complete
MTAIISTVGTMAASILQGNAESEQYIAQAEQAKVQSRVSALNYTLESNAIKERVIANLASSTARAAAGGLSPFQSGSSNHYLDLASLSGAMRDSRISLNNAEIARKMGTYQANQYFSAARTSRRMGKIMAFTKGAQNVNEMASTWSGGATSGP